MPDASRKDETEHHLATLYDAHAGWMFRHALMLLGNHAGAEDAVQRVFEKLLAMGGGAARIDSPRGYLRTAVRRECYRALGSGARESPGDTGALLEVVDRAAPDDGTREQLEHALRKLPPEQREAVHLKLYEGMTFEQVAREQRVSPNTAASRYRYALEKLRELLDADGR